MNYAGTKISLISRSDIRYVGTLHTINAQESTVALEQVRSFGTEGRKEKPEDEIPPSDQVFEYIVFRGSDVKDLTVLETPGQKPLATQVPNDPAILGTTAPPRPPGFQSFPSPIPQQYPTNPNPYMVPTISNFVSSQYWPQQQPQAFQPVASFPSDQPDPNRKESQGTQTAASQKAPSKEPQRQEQPVQEERKPSNYQPAQRPRNDRNDYRNDYRNNRGYDQRQYSQAPRRHSNSGQRPPRRNYTPNKAALPKRDFDFESANAKFNKEDLLKEFSKLSINQSPKLPEETPEEPAPSAEPAEEVVIPPNEAYNKDKSFFDNISCEATERGPERKGLSFNERRHKMNHERKINIETFGQATPHHLRYRYGNQRGGYRGNYRGSRNYYRQNDQPRQSGAVAAQK